MTFDEATRKFRTLDAQYAAGQITLDSYRANLADCRVTDADGRVWMPQERTGAWYVYLDGKWQPGSALKQPAPPPPAPGPSFQTAGDQIGTLIRRGTPLWVSLVIWFFFVAVFTTFAIVLSHEFKLVAIIAGVGAIALVIILLTAASSWKGQIIDMRLETRRTRDSDGSTHTSMVNYAFVRQDDGKIKKVQARLGWRVGDLIEKKKGETTPGVSR